MKLEKGGKCRVMGLHAKRMADSMAEGDEDCSIEHGAGAYALSKAADTQPEKPKEDL